MDLKKITPLQKKGHNYRLMSEINAEYSSLTLLFNYGSHKISGQKYPHKTPTYLKLNYGLDYVVASIMVPKREFDIP
jgi:hypothetical protein